MQCMKCFEHRNDVCERKALKKLLPHEPICDICYSIVSWNIYEAYKMILGELDTIGQEYEMFHKLTELSKRR